MIKDFNLWFERLSQEEKESLISLMYGFELSYYVKLDLEVNKPKRDEWR